MIHKRKHRVSTSRHTAAEILAGIVRPNDVGRVVELPNGRRWWMPEAFFRDDGKTPMGLGGFGISIYLSSPGKVQGDRVKPKNQGDPTQ